MNFLKIITTIGGSLVGSGIGLLVLALVIRIREGRQNSVGSFLKTGLLLITAGCLVIAGILLHYGKGAF